MKIKGYRIEEILEERDDIIIAKATQVSLDRTVFLKMLMKLAEAADIHQQFIREARLLARLNHPNIVTIHEFNAQHDPPYLVLEYFHGQDLSQVLTERGPLTAEPLLSVMQQALAGCAKAHEAGILHRDLKPANLLMNQEGQVKLTDFGLAAVLDQQQQPVAGSPGYLAPELALGDVPTRQSDIYALGMTFYTLAVGSNPLVGKNLNESLNLAIKTEPENLSEIRQDIPEKMAGLIHRMIRKAAGDRYQDCDTIIEQLQEIHIGETRTRERMAERGPLAFRPRSGKHEPVSDIDLLDTPTRKDWLLGLAFFVLLVVAIYSWSTSKKPDNVVPYPIMTGDSARVEPEMANDALQREDSGTDTLVTVVDSGHEEIGDRAGKGDGKSGVPTSAPNDDISDEGPLSPENDGGALFLAAIPWAQIRIDSMEIGTTPFSEPIPISTGKHTVHFLHPDYPDFTKSVEIEPGKTDSIWLNWRKELGFLAINVFPWADIYVNSQYADVTPIEKPFPLQPGEYQVLLKNPDFTPWHRFVQITAGDTLEITVRLGEGSVP